MWQARHRSEVANNGPCAAAALGTRANSAMSALVNTVGMLRSG